MARRDVRPQPAHQIAEPARAVVQCFQPRDVIFVFSPDSLSRELVRTLYTDRRTLFRSESSASSKPELTVILDSPGGDIHASYLITKLLRAHCSHLVVVVPRWAKSAATLLCLGADEIVMTDIAELGPLDPLVRRPGETASRPVLDEYLALDAVRRDTITTLDILVPLLIERTGMDVSDLLGLVCSFVSDLMVPVYSQIDPHTHGSHMRAMNISKEYAIRVLRQWSKVNPEEVAERFTTGYPSHDFIIDLPELQELGLPARRVTDDEDEVLRPLIKLSQRATIIGRVEMPEEEAEREVAASAEEPTSNKAGKRVRSAGTGKNE